MRPRKLQEFAGWDALIAGSARFLGPALAKQRLPSLILWGPPGCGKTTLARLLGERCGLPFEPFSAVMGGLADLRKVFARAEQQAGLFTGGVLLFVDELHRLNRAQQDALLPHMESGRITLIGATTEHPSFTIGKAVLSRARVVRMEALSEEVLGELIERALGDADRGLGAHALSIDADAKALLVRAAEGDARRALRMLEATALLVTQHDEASSCIKRADVERGIDGPVLRHDRAGDDHYDVVSAFIKSMRGNDPDGSLYWMVRMLESGEDPRFIFRRMLIFASEDIGNADPRALELTVSAAAAFERVGRPEGDIIMAHACTYLASTAKSNAAYAGLRAAQGAVQQGGSLPVPNHLRNAPTQLDRQLGHAQGYRYPHDEGGHATGVRYLPDALGQMHFYKPKDVGAESHLKRRLEHLHGPRSSESATAKTLDRDS